MKILIFAQIFAREAPGELWSPPGYVPGATRIVLLRPRAPQSDFDSILAQCGLDWGSIWDRFWFNFHPIVFRNRRSFVHLLVCLCDGVVPMPVSGGKLTSSAPVATNPACYTRGATKLLVQLDVLCNVAGKQQEHTLSLIHI